MNDKGTEYVVWSWASKDIEDTFENRLAMMFCGYWNKEFGDHFSGRINFNSKKLFTGHLNYPLLSLKKFFY